jgi:hypothetical protein
VSDKATTAALREIDPRILGLLCGYWDQRSDRGGVPLNFSKDVCWLELAPKLHVPIHTDIQRSKIMTTRMLTLIAAGSLLIGSCASGLAESSTQERTPGDQMQDKGSVKGSPGASGYAPGQQMQSKGSVKGTTGASGYAPGQTTGSKASSDHDRDDAMRAKSK